MRTSFLSRLLDTIAPRECALCGQRLSPTEMVVCGACHLTMPATHYADHPTDNPMARNFWGLLPVERAAALVYYQRDTPVALMIHNLKYHNQPGIARRMGEYTARQFMPHHFFDGIDLLVPVPLTWRRQWQRGYNQSYEICRGINSATGIPIGAKVLKRTQFKGSQTQLATEERRQNVSNVFTLADPEAVSGKHVLLVDDVVTTGATLTACGQQLIKANDVRLSLLSLAVVRPG